MFYWDQAIQNEFTQASKELPHGCRPDPIHWCTNELEEMLQAQTESWTYAMSSNYPQDWKQFQDNATAFSDTLQKAKPMAWEEHSATLSYSTNPTKVMST